MRLFLAIESTEFEKEPLKDKTFNCGTFEIHVFAPSADYYKMKTSPQEFLILVESEPRINFGSRAVGYMERQELETDLLEFKPVFDEAVKYAAEMREYILKAYEQAFYEEALKRGYSKGAANFSNYIAAAPMPVGFKSFMKEIVAFLEDRKYISSTERDRAFDICERIKKNLL